MWSEKNWSGYARVVNNSLWGAWGHSLIENSLKHAAYDLSGSLEWINYQF